MTDKKGIFNFFKGWSSVTEEEQQQREHAMSMEKGAENSSHDSYNNSDSFKVSSQEPELLVTDEIELFAIEQLESILDLSGFSGKVNLKRKYGDRLNLEIFDSGDDAGRIIGKNGRTLEAFQILLKNFVIRKFNVNLKINVDAGEYRNRRYSQLKSKALKAADDIINEGDKVTLDPMNAQERRVVHMLFEKNDAIETVSEGSGENRRVALVKRQSAY